MKESLPVKDVMVSTKHKGPSENVNSVTKLLSGIEGKNVRMSFYENEEDMDLLVASRQDKIILPDIDSEWAMIRIETPQGVMCINEIAKLLDIKVSFL